MDRLDDAYRRLEHGPGESRRAVAGEIAEMELMLGIGDLEISQDEPKGEQMKVIYVGKSGDHWFMIRYEDGKARVWATRWGQWAAKELAEGHPLARSGMFRQGLTLPQVVNDAGQQRTLDEPVTEGWVYG